MSKVLIVAEHLNGQLNSATARCVTCAQAMKAESIDIVVLSDAPDAIAAQAAQIAGVSKVITIANAANEAQRLNLSLTGSPASSSTARLSVRRILLRGSANGSPCGSSGAVMSKNAAS